MVMPNLKTRFFLHQIYLDVFLQELFFIDSYRPFAEN